jgi:hypothetical protein
LIAGINTERGSNRQRHSDRDCSITLVELWPDQIAMLVDGKDWSLSRLRR